MMDPTHAPGPETSGTAFFTYGFLWGINNGYLDEAVYKPVIDKAWNYLTKTALQKNGKIGYVQPIGEKAIPGQVVDADSVAIRVVLFCWLLVNMSVIWKLLKIRIAPTGAICFIRWQLPY